ncbi:MAG: hypothetical protein LBD53_06715 [Tannerella sp.]|nr:hypothetical protein [Tannerella sp.]
MFAAYYSGISFFRHTHVINGVTIVHSHPYKKSAEKKPEHRHDEAQIQLINMLSQFSIHSCGTSVQIDAPYSFCISETGTRESNPILKRRSTNLRLRAPPIAA